MTHDEAILISAYTGYLFCDFSEVHEFCEKLIGKPILTHEFANRKILEEIQEKCKPLIFELLDNIQESEVKKE